MREASVGVSAVMQNRYHPYYGYGIRHAASPYYAPSYDPRLHPNHQPLINSYAAQFTNSAVHPQLPSKPDPGYICSPPGIALRAQRPQKPPYSYIALITMAIESTSAKRATLAEICGFIRDRYDYYRDNCKQGWENSIRHNLSLNDCFMKLPREQGRPGKGHFWVIDPGARRMFDDGSYRRRKRRYKKGDAPESSEDEPEPQITGQGIESLVATARYMNHSAVSHPGFLSPNTPDYAIMNRAYEPSPPFPFLTTPAIGTRSNEIGDIAPLIAYSQQPSIGQTAPPSLYQETELQTAVTMPQSASSLIQTTELYSPQHITSGSSPSGQCTPQNAWSSPIPESTCASITGTLDKIVQQRVTQLNTVNHLSESSSEGECSPHSETFPSEQTDLPFSFIGESVEDELPVHIPSIHNELQKHE